MTDETQCVEFKQERLSDNVNDIIEKANEWVRSNKDTYDILGIAICFVVNEDKNGYVKAARVTYKEKE